MNYETHGVWENADGSETGTWEYAEGSDMSGTWYNDDQSATHLSGTWDSEAGNISMRIAVSDIQTGTWLGVDQSMGTWTGHREETFGHWENDSERGTWEYDEGSTESGTWFNENDSDRGTWSSDSSIGYRIAVSENTSGEWAAIDGSYGTWTHSPDEGGRWTNGDQTLTGSFDFDSDTDLSGTWMDD